MKFSSLLTRSVMMSKIQNDAYYTPKELAYTLCRKTIEIIGDKNIYDVIEPSAGCGTVCRPDK